MRNLVFILTAAAIYAAPQPAVEDRVLDKFIPAPFERQKIEGLLGERMRVNLEGRLLHVDETALLEGFQHPPGKQAWIGEHAGKFLHAAANTWRYTHDERLKSMMERMVPALLAAQRPDGYLGTYTDDKRWTSWDVWVHKYNLIGLLSYYQISGYDPALQGARKIGDLLVRTFGDAPGQMDIINSGTHVGMAATSILEPMVMLYRYTADKRYLNFCYYITRAYDQPNGPKIIRSLVETGSVFKTANAKAYEMMSNLVGLADLYRITGDENFLAPALAAWKDITSKRLYITGTTSSKEHFQDDFDLPGGEEANVGEGCATVTWLQLNWQLLRITGEARYADELERTVYNQLLGAQDPHNGNICYFTPLVGRKKPGPGINCCVSSEPRGISMIPQLAWGEREGGVAVIFYTPGEATIGGIRLKSDSQYPAEGREVLTIRPVHEARFALHLRVPSWTTRYEATAGGKKYAGKPGEFLRIERKWKPGDQVAIQMDMTPRLLDGGKSYTNQVALARGPQVLALERELNPRFDSAVLKSADVKPATLPDGRLAYSVDGLTFVPFSDAQDYRVWIAR